MPNNNVRRNNRNGARQVARRPRNNARSVQNAVRQMLRSQRNNRVRQAQRPMQRNRTVMQRITVINSNGQRMTINVPPYIVNSNYNYNRRVGAYRRRNYSRRAPMSNRMGGMWN